MKGGFISRSSSIESSGPSTKSSSTVSYTAFDGSSYQLRENRGHYVNVLLPQAYTEGVFFTPDHIEELVDRLDMLYALYTELMHYEPLGDGLLNVAFVPQTCGMGCGLIGTRGFEILSYPQNYEAIIRELDAGRLEPVLLHEMAHNFDAHSAYLHYLPDHAHAWTSIFEFFAPFRYSRISSHDQAPDDLYNSPVSAVWKDYVNEASADWKRCVLNDSCGNLGLTANSLWAMLYYRVEALHGIEAILGSLEFLRDHVQSNPPPATLEEKESLRILSLATGAGANISCYMDALKWPIQANLRSELERNFGSTNGFCTDLDGDGFSAVNGDCDDDDASRNISAIELAGNGIDDDCDELVDEKNLVEAQAGQASDNFTIAVQTTIPFEVEGSGAHSEDRDTFGFSIPATGRTRVTLCAHGEFKGWLAALQANGRFLESDKWYVYQGQPGCTSDTFDFGGLTDGGLVVIADETQGEYSLTVTPAVDLLPEHSSSVTAVANPEGGMKLLITDTDGMFRDLGTDEIEIWISGAGVQLFEPFETDLNVELNTSTVPQLQHGHSYQVRIRPRADGLPLAAFSAGHLFRYDKAPSALPVIDDRFSGAWFDSTHDGEGFIVEILDNNRAVVFWFTYHEDGRQRWMLGTGKVQGNRIVINKLKDTHGGRFGADFNPADVWMNTVGSLSLSFLDCSTALVNYSVDNNGDHQATSRLTQVYGHGCDGIIPPLDRDFSGSWFDPSHDGEGFIIEQIGASRALVFWFTYDDAGNQAWFHDTGTINNGSIDLPQLLQAKGGRFGRSFDPATVTRHEWGELMLNLECHGGTANYTTQTEGYSSGSQSLVPLTRLAGSSCAD